MINQLSTQKKVMAYSLLLIVAYIVTGKLGLMLALPPGYASAIFPPAGIAIAAVFVTGRVLLPAILLGSFLLNILVGYSASHQVKVINVEVALLIAVASALQAYLGGWWLKRKISYPTTLDSPIDVVTFFISAPVICLISATISVTGLLSLGLIEKPLFFTSWASWWIGDTLGLIVMLPLTLVAIGKPRNIWRKRALTIAVPMLITFALLIITFVVVSRWERKESLVEFDALSNQLSEQLRVQFLSQEAVIEQTSALFSYRANDWVSRQDFYHFVSAVKRNYPMTYAIEWAPKITHRERAAYEKKLSQEFKDFEIKELSAQRKLVTSSDKDFYFPITYIVPLKESTRAILGVDLASIPDRKDAIQSAISLKKAIASPPTKLIINNGTESGLMLIYPIHGTNQDGVLSTVLRSGSFFGELFTPFAHTVHVRLTDMQSGMYLFNNFTDNQIEGLYTRNFKFGGRYYRLDTSPTTQYYQQHRGWQSWNMLAIGLFGTGLMGSLLLIGTGYTARIENLVKQKTEELKESFYRFQEITSTMGEGIYVTDINGVITFTNPKAQELLGRSETELLGQNSHVLFHHKRIDGSFYPEDECLIRNVIRTKQPYKSTEEVFWHQDGTPIYVAVNSVPFFRNNDIIGNVVVFDDISDRKKIEHALRASEKSFKEIIEYAPIGIAIVSLDGRFTVVNQTLCNIVGYTNDELIRRTFQEITHPDDLSIDLEHVQQLLDGKIDTYRMEKRYIRKDKTEVWVQLSASIFRDEELIPQYFIAQIEDISERKIRDNEVHQHAYFDTLTKLPNRRMLMDRLSQALSQSERYQRTLALFFLDLDHFKQINDTLGHDAGDRVLKVAAARLLSCVRSHDTVARLGGDEFVIVLTEISSAQDAKMFAEKILKKFSEPIDVNGKELFVGTSIGIAVYSGDSSITIKELMNNADAAMYESKAAGRNRYYFYTPT
nr:diguanylate cyclase [uncultured Methylotenera sp.]